MTENEKTVAFLFDEAMKLRDVGDLVAARRLLTRLLEQLTPEDKLLRAHAHIQLGQFARTLGDPAEREGHFRMAARALPSSELASCGLFLALHDLGRLPEAFQEMVRFLRTRYSELYDEILQTPQDCAEFVGEVHELIVEARRLLAARRPN